MKHIVIYSLLIGFLSPAAFANRFALHGNAGLVNLHLSHHQSQLWMNEFMENKYSLKHTSQHEPLWGIGADYEWNIESLTVNLGASFYYLKSTISGINTPFINEPLLNAPTLNYTASSYSYAFMLEPKFILTKEIWQPYFFMGAGLSMNKLSGYSEAPTLSGSGASPTQLPFANKNTSHLAYEFGVGIQRAFNMGSHHPLLALDYRYMNWGNARFGQATDYPHNHLNMGKLDARILSLNLIWPI